MKSSLTELGAERLDAAVLGDGDGLARSLRGRLRLRERSKSLFRQWESGIC